MLYTPGDPDIIFMYNIIFNDIILIQFFKSVYADPMFKKTTTIKLQTNLRVGKVNLSDRYMPKSIGW